MYLPEHFREDRPEVLRRLMREFPLATLVTTGADGIEANHVPMILDAEAGLLRGHLSRANSQWKTGGDALAIFQGPQAYVSPNWYPAKGEHGRVVATWNYAVVHARGRLKVYDDPVRLREFLDLLTQEHEAEQPNPWSMADAPANYVEGLLKALVGIDLEITSLTGKWKVSQNQPADNREGAAAGLEEMAGLIRADTIRYS